VGDVFRDLLSIVQLFFYFAIVAAVWYENIRLRHVVGGEDGILVKVVT
jgi:hypothetical protein